MPGSRARPLKSACVWRAFRPRRPPATPAAEVRALEEFHPAHQNGNGHDGTNGNGNGARHVIEELAEAFTRDVEVTRRLYRSGESEYLIDGAVCRLRDVHELLMDTGLGAKAYSIIEQGKIGMILSSRPGGPAPADRRSRRDHEVPLTPTRGRTEARSRPAEPRSHRRHRLRSREAARRAEAAGGQGAPVRPAARRISPLGKGALCAALSRSGGLHRIGARQTDRRQGARDSGAGASRGGRSAPGATAHRAGRGRGSLIADPRRRPRPRARHQPAAAAAGIQSPADRDARWPRHGDRRRDPGARVAARAGARGARVTP